MFVRPKVGDWGDVDAWFLSDFKVLILPQSSPLLPEYHFHPQIILLLVQAYPCGIEYSVS